MRTAAPRLAMAWLALTLLAVSLALLPAAHPWAWMLRVALPEVGWVLGLSAIPGLLALGRHRTGASAALGLGLALPLLAPWWQAWQLSTSLSARWEHSLGPTSLSQRSPLTLASPDRATMTSEPYAGALWWDRYRPASGPIRARLLFVHGGSWRNGTRGDYPQLFWYLAGLGYEVLCPTVSLAPAHPYPAPLDDLARAMAAIPDDGLPLLLGGRSSGGHLALLAAYRQPHRVAGVVAFYPPVDMLWSYQHPSNPAVLDSCGAIVDFLGAPPESSPTLYAEASPRSLVDSSTPPTLLIHGQRDSLVYPRQSEMLLEALQQAGRPAFLLDLPWAEHGGDILLGGPTGRLSCWAIEAFLEAAIAPHRSP